MAYFVQVMRAAWELSTHRVLTRTSHAEVREIGEIFAVDILTRIALPISSDARGCAKKEFVFLHSFAKATLGGTGTGSAPSV